MRYEQIEKLEGEKFRRLTGIKQTTFNRMVEILDEEDRRKKAKSGRKSKLCIEDRLLMALEYMREMKERTIICKLVLSFRSQFFHNRLHFSNQAKDRSTTHLFGNTAKECNSLRFITSTAAPIIVFI